MENCEGPTLTMVRRAIKEGGHEWYSEPFRVNLVGVRTPNARPGSFDDWMTCSWTDDAGMLFFRRWRICADPSSFWRRHPLNAGAGSAILTPGKHVGLWKIGTHRGRHLALVQCADATLWTSSARKKTTRVSPLDAETSRFGVACHWQDARPFRWANGAQVFKEEDHFAEFLAIVRHSLRVFPGSVDYTLIEGERKK